MEGAIYMTGVIVWTFLGVVCFGLALIGACRVLNRACWYVLECYGGIKTFNEFRHWYYNERKDRTP